jgi:hypothetical protein
LVAGGTLMLYIKTTLDKYEFPIAVADSAAELAKMLGVKADTVYSQISKKRRGWYKVSCEADDRNEDIT